MHAKVVHLACVIASSIRRSLMMAVAAADREANSAVTKTARLALNSSESASVVNNQVVARVLAEWYENCETNFP
ncbi:MAG: hypothetical protein QOK34_633 [Gaiellaceae bacterium]|nr:hypothetical protein [Gaiellaceae bacterium]